MKQQIIAAALAALSLFSASAVMPAQTAFAEPVSAASVYSSDYLTSYNSFATKVGSGQMDITFKVVAPIFASEIGVSKIEIYKASGSKVKTVYGSTANGLQASDISMHAGTYSYSGTPGTTYYAKVTVFASDGSGSDSRTIITNSVTL